jgi:hypothetical protein
MATILKLSSNRRNGSALLHLGQNKLDTSRATLSMFICFFYIDGVVHKEFVPPSEAVNKDFCRDV